MLLLQLQILFLVPTEMSSSLPTNSQSGLIQYVQIREVDVAGSGKKETHFSIIQHRILTKNKQLKEMKKGCYIFIFILLYMSLYAYAPVHLFFKQILCQFQKCGALLSLQVTEEQNGPSQSQTGSWCNACPSRQQTYCLLGICIHKPHREMQHVRFLISRFSIIKLFILHSLHCSFPY